MSAAAGNSVSHDRDAILIRNYTRLSNKRANHYLTTNFVSGDGGGGRVALKGHSLINPWSFSS